MTIARRGKVAELKPPVFGYADPRTTEEAIEAAWEFGNEAKFLAGGQSLVPLLNMRLSRPSHLIDLRHIQPLVGIREEGDCLAIGSMTTQFAIETSDVVAASCPLLSYAVPHIGHRAIRYRGTIGGSLTHADPAAELPAVALALDAVMEVSGPNGSRRISASDFFITWFTTALSPGEVLTTVRIPKQPKSSGSAFLEISRRHGDFAVAGVAAMVEISNEGSFRDPRLVAFGVGSAPLRLKNSEEALSGGPNWLHVLEDVARVAREEVETKADIHGTAEYRTWVLGNLVKRAVAEAARKVEVGDDGLE